MFRVSFAPLVEEIVLPKALRHFFGCRLTQPLFSALHGTSRVFGAARRRNRVRSGRASCFRSMSTQIHYAHATHGTPSHTTPRGKWDQACRQELASPPRAGLSTRSPLELAAARATLARQRGTAAELGIRMSAQGCSLDAKAARARSCAGNASQEREVGGRAASLEICASQHPWRVARSRPELRGQR